jgi:hypothetical protein
MFLPPGAQNAANELFGIGANNIRAELNFATPTFAGLLGII